ncbi:MAG: deoxyguanosinetriphosphate triphosphohydrolase [Rhodobacteraceae bacterium]|nr:deoxyguanosinetriphosphate triphosphohydrolase [Paracoccaceae bacterium]MBT4776635.1 deoxyguanosinetriphosphate triphosphohydrolase [Paracoccaceae bacterium]|tara:strand:+ start:9344 stop:10489 length:1146 start_codon:yes stop_codon:yes gene_type:complete
MLALYASNPQQSRGRLFKEDDSTYRSCFQRDRDRIIHSSSFRRLKHKTQVFLENEGDYFRTRLTHTIEVAQVARTIASALGLEVDLAEGISLAHDLGHPPFGHTGEEALDILMMPYGGFDHNSQSVLIVTSLERHYAQWDGLNLSWEVLEGMAKHNGPMISGIPEVIREYSSRHNLELQTFSSGEAQVAAIADDIAYNHHDVLDGIRAGLLSVDDIRTLPILASCFNEVDKLYPGIDNLRQRHEALRSFFNFLVSDVIIESKKLLGDLSAQSVIDIRNATKPVIQFSPKVRDDLDIIRAFLFKEMYRSPPLLQMRKMATQITNELFTFFLRDQVQLPKKWQADLQNCSSKTNVARVVSDYIAGMTDRFAISEHRRLCKSLE